MSLDAFILQVGAARDARTSADEPPTNADVVAAILAVDNEADARRFYDGFVQFHAQVFPNPEGLSPMEIADLSIGYAFGEGMESARIAMWVRATGVKYPLLGLVPFDRDDLVALGLGPEKRKAKIAW